MSGGHVGSVDGWAQMVQMVRSSCTISSVAYRYTGVPLVSSIVEKLIPDMGLTGPMTRNEIVGLVTDEHIKRGGLPGGISLVWLLALRGCHQPIRD